LPQRDRKRQRLQRHERLAERGAASDPVPTRQKPAKGGLLGRLDFLPQRRQRGAPQASEDVRIAPLPLCTAGSKLAADELLVTLELVQDRFHIDPEVLARLGRRQPARAARARALAAGGTGPPECPPPPRGEPPGQPGGRPPPGRAAGAPGPPASARPPAPADPTPRAPPLRLEHSRVRLVERPDQPVT